MLHHGRFVLVLVPVSARWRPFQCLLWPIFLTRPREQQLPCQVAPGSIPADLVATAVGQKVTTPNGVVYEPLELGTSETGPRNGPPRGGANLLLKYAAHIQSFDGPVVDSSTFRGSRKPNKVDYVECRLNVDPSLPNCLFEVRPLALGWRMLAGLVSRK
ncbi:unnamed protein product [Symbiodinium natans]|uniref:Peptidylprolyl isomerase n=1 Tax=Symbiodinium natans TaxID=878477 RepID=A0A812JIS8_9DINO|nr:unnamed protein product [Symbiodinium natans]